MSATQKELEVTASARATSECQGLRPLVVVIFILKLKNQILGLCDRLKGVTTAYGFFFFSNPKLQCVQ